MNFIEPLKQRWQTLAVRERLTVACGGIIVLIALFYFYIWQPLAAATTNLQQQLQEDRILLQWMQPAVQLYLQLKTQGVTPQRVSSQPLLLTINETLQQTQLSPFVKQIIQSDGGSVQVTFDKVPFDYCMQWLQLLWKQYAIDVEQLSATPLPIPGLVQMNLTLKSSS